MALWYKQGVWGKLNREAADGLRHTQAVFAKHGEDVFVTSVRDGTHGPESLHPQGDAWDMRPSKTVTLEELRGVLGNGYDVVDEGNHWHVEYDPEHGG